jgi:hypothetical protein
VKAPYVIGFESALIAEKQARAWSDISNSNLQVPDEIAAWLARAKLLYGVPFEYLVPDASLLPPESIRFFHLDERWLDALLDGALSVGKTSTFEYVHHERTCQAVRDAVKAASAELRKTMRDSMGAKDARKSTDIDATDTTAETGFLLRSRLVSAFPGMEVVAKKAAKVLPLMRLDRPAPDLMLALFAGVPEQVRLVEPAEGVTPGFITDGGVMAAQLRTPGGDGHLNPGAVLKNLLAGRGSGVLDVGKLGASAATVAGNALSTPTDILFETAVPADLVREASDFGKGGA